MNRKSDYDVLIIGAGQAGVPLAGDLAKAGRRVALAERKHLGGSCVNFGCTPTKAVIASARVAHLARRAADFGVRIPTVEVDFPAVLARARRLVREFRESNEKTFQESNPTLLLCAHARLDGRDDGGAFRVRVGEQMVTASEVVLNTGTRSLIPPIAGLDEVDFLDAGNWLEWDDLPQHLVLLGGGYIGLEMAQFYRRMGSRVTVVDEGEQVIGHEDRDIAEALQRLLEAEGIEFRLGARATAITGRSGAGGVTVTLEQENGQATLDASHLFVATGRKPNTDDLGLETVGVRMSEKGFIETDERLVTSVEGIWVAGDIRGGPMFTHTSWDDYRVLLSQMTGDEEQPRRTTDRIVPYALFTEPQLGRVGMSEKQAREAGSNIQVGIYAMESNGQASERGETEGFIKVVVDAETQKLLGAAVLSAEGAEIVHAYIAIMNADAPVDVIKNAVHIHPTLSEAIQSAVSSLE